MLDAWLRVKTLRETGVPHNPSVVKDVLNQPYGQN